ncbi:MAG: PDDEXK nuclease domain-containing protein [Candidatus Omnitrophota bacterium]
MKRYWVVAPYDSRKPDVFDVAWNYDLQNGTIAVGWSKLGDISRLNEKELKDKYLEHYSPDDPADRNALWRFYHEISVGDVILARRGRKKLLAMGEVVGTAVYDLNKGKERIGNKEGYVYPNLISVKWEEKNIDYGRQVFAIRTLYEIPSEKFDLLVKGEVSEEVEEQEQIKEHQEFVLEKYLEDFIVSNFDSIFDHRLKLYEDEEGVGQQYPTDIGTIDILAFDPEEKAYVVIELKKGRESDKVVGQILRYMGWVKKNLAKENEKVRGLIVCKDKDEKLDYSLEAIPGCNIQVRLYKINFKLV